MTPDVVYMERHPDGIVLVGGPREKELVQRVPGGRYDRNSGMWLFPLGWATCVAARGVFGDRLQVGPELAAWSWMERRRLDTLAALKTADVVHPDVDRWADLKSWQRPGANWMALTERALNLDGTGLGKMIQTLMALRLVGASIFPALVICPNSLKMKWAAEWENWGPAHGGIVVVDGTLTQKRKQLAQDASVVIINWEALRLHSRLAPFGSVELTEAERTPKELDEWEFKTVVADELHRACDPKAKQTRAWWNLSHAATRSYGLTATPLTKKPDDFWSIGHGLWPENFPRKTSWVNRYCHSGQNLHGGFEVWGFREENKAELFSFVDPFMVRRTGEVAGQEPPIQETRPLILGSKQAKAYRDLEKEMMTQVGDEFIVAGTPLELRIRLRQTAAGMPVVEDGKVVALAMPSCKIDALLDTLNDEPDEPLVVFAESRLLIELASRVLEKHKISHVCLVGGLGSTVLHQLEAQFQDEDGGVRVALCTYGAVSEGISLGRSRHLIRLEVSNQLVQNIQSVGRIDGLRRQHAGPPLVTDFIVTGTVDEDVTVNNLEKGVHLDTLTRDRLRRTA